MLKSLLSHATSQVLEDAIYSELYASHLYKHVANQCQRLGYFGAAKFFRAESADELEHYQKWVDYMNDRGSVAKLPALPAIAESITDLGSALMSGYNAEVSLGKNYAAWYTAVHPSDPTTAAYMLQFLDTQRASVGEYGDLLARYELAKGNPAAVLLLDQELGA